MTNIGDQIAAESMKHIGKDYVHATQGPNTFDCSGLVQYCYIQVTGEWITAGSEWQWEDPSLGDWIYDRADFRPGDIICYDIAGNNKCGHTGIYIGDNQMVNALNETWGVEIDPVYDPGPGGKWTGYWGDVAILLGARRKYPYSGSTPTDPPPTTTPTRGEENPTITGTLLTPSLRRSTTLVDLGEKKKIAGVTWTLSTDAADATITVESSLDGMAFAAVGRGMYDKPVSTERRGVKVDIEARYIRTTITHAAAAVKVGHLVDLKVYASSGTTTPPEGDEWTHRVVGDVNFRTGAGTSNPIIRTLPAGTRLRLISGPTSANGYQWYNVEAEGFGTGYMIDSFEQIAGTPPPTTTPTWTHVVDNGPLNLRSGAGTSYGVIGSLSNGVKLKVLAGPVNANGYAWYQVETDTNLTGWCVQGFSPL